MQARVDWVLNIFGTQVTKKKRPVRPVFPDYLSVSYDYDPNKETFLITPTSDEEISEIISDLNIRKSTRPNSIPTKVMKQIKHVI